MDRNLLQLPQYNSSPYRDDEMDDVRSAMGYQQTLMYGRYSKSLGDEFREELKRQKLIEKQRKKEVQKRKKELSGKNECNQKVSRVLGYVWSKTFARFGEDWVFLALLGVTTAVISFSIDTTITMCNKAKFWLVKDLISHVGLQFLAWTSLTVLLILFSTGFVHIVSPQAIGSGLPEMKTILRGVVLKEYLSFRTLIAKIVGLTATLGSGIPLGKEGPFVHISCMVCCALSKLISSFQNIRINESRHNEMLAAACAVGVAACFGAPIGGVLFSIEVTTVYFAVRNYWRGFFGAACGAVVFRLLAIWFHNNETFEGVFRTNFNTDFPYDPRELFAFALIGLLSGLGGGLYIFLHRRYVLWMRGNKRLSKFLQKNRFIYPFFVSFAVAILSFPYGPGMFHAADLTFAEQSRMLFSNFTWSQDIANMTVEEFDKVKHWRDPYSENVLVSLTGFVLYTFCISIVGLTLPVPNGVFVPTFKIGAGLGRLIGELMHLMFPAGMRIGNEISYIIPGGYATVGAAAFSGAVTRTLSTCVILQEMTGQVTHLVPMLIAVIISNFVANRIEPSIFDNIIIIKKLPYLPDIIPSSSGAYDYFVQSFMVKDVKYIWHGMSYAELKEVLKEGRKLKGFPLVDNSSQMVLLGSIQRQELIGAIERQIGKERRMAEALVRLQEKAERRRLEELKKAEEMEKRIQEFEKDSENKGETERQQPAAEERARRPSRFAVSTVEDQHRDTDIPSTMLQLPDINSPAMRALAHLSLQPKKSILKKNSTIHGFSYASSSPFASPYQTYTGGNERWRNTVQSMQHMLRRGGSSFNMGSSRGSNWDFGSDMGSFTGKKVSMRHDLSLGEQQEWEQQEMEKPVNFAELHADPAPFQLVEKSNLIKVHSMFSMLGVNLAYVTTLGRLIGVVGLKELREAIEDVNSGKKKEDTPTAKEDDDMEQELKETNVEAGELSGLSESEVEKRLLDG